MGRFGPIPWPAIDCYAERYGLDEFERFRCLIRGQDWVHLKHLAEKAKGAGKP